MPTKTNPNRQARRARSRTNGAARKALRIKRNQEQAAANRTAGKTPRNHSRKRKADNLKICNRCHHRVILAGTVCSCSKAMS